MKLTIISFMFFIFTANCNTKLASVAYLSWRIVLNHFFGRMIDPRFDFSDLLFGGLFLTFWQKPANQAIVVLACTVLEARVGIDRPNTDL